MDEAIAPAHGTKSLQRNYDRDKHDGADMIFLKASMLKKTTEISIPRDTKESSTLPLFHTYKTHHQF